MLVEISPILDLASRPKAVVGRMCYHSTPPPPPPDTQLWLILKTTGLFNLAKVKRRLKNMESTPTIWWLSNWWLDIQLSAWIPRSFSLFTLLWPCFPGSRLPFLALRLVGS